MKPSIEIIDFIKQYESLHDGDLSKIGLQPKLCPAGYWTEGYGKVLTGPSGEMLKYSPQYKTIASVLPFSTIDDEREAYQDLVQGVNKRAGGVMARLRVPVKQTQFDALVSHAYNCGFSETLYKLINSRQDELKIRNWFTTKYVTAGGVYMKGLQHRRNDEWQIYKGINYKREYLLSA